MQTKRILTSQAVPGMIVADDIYTFNNQMILAKGSKLTNRAITRLKFYSINDIRIDVSEGEADDSTEGVAPVAETPATGKSAASEITMEPLVEHVRKTKEFRSFHKEYNTTVTDFESSLKQIVTDKQAPLDTSALLKRTEGILSHRRNGMHLFHMLHCMRDYQDETFAHSISVAMICNAMGIWLKWPEDEVEKLTLAGLLHDIGKIYMPDTILHKKGNLSETEFSMIKTHPRKGYNVLRGQQIDERIKLAALMHHERCDGTGYPSNLVADRIDDFAKIVAIADTYDAMTSPRIYRGPLCPFEVIQLFQSEGLTQYDPHYLMTFLDKTAETYLHSLVQLSDGRQGEIVLINHSDLSKPTIKVGNQYVNLFKENNLRITAML